MKKILAILLMSLLLVSCADDNGETSNKELKQEIDFVNSPDSEKTKPKQDKVIEVDVEGDSPYSLGTDYNLLEKPFDTGTKNQVVVYEFFGYTCAHCFYFEPFIQKWIGTKSTKIKFVRVPLNFQRGWEIFQKAYLTAELMGIAEITHKMLFEELHNKHKKFKSIDELAGWYAENTEVSKEEFLSTADSFMLDSKQRQADKMGFLMGITGTPALIVNGKYSISKKIRDRNEIMAIMDYLAKKEMKEMGLFY